MRIDLKQGCTPILSSGYSRFFEKLRWFEEIKKNYLPANSILFSVDVTGLYTNIPQDDGLEFYREALASRTDKSFSTSFLIELICLKNNIVDARSNVRRISSPKIDR